MPDSRYESLIAGAMYYDYTGQRLFIWAGATDHWKYVDVNDHDG
jgi:hypothetical protein